MGFVQVENWLKFKTRPSSLLNFGTANSHLQASVVGNKATDSRS